VNVPIGITAALLGWRSLPVDQQRRAHSSLDIVGAVLVTVATATLVYLPALGITDGWSSVPVVGGALLVVLLFATFVVWERRQANPLVRLAIFRLRTLRAANMITAFYGAWNAGEVLILALYLQRVLHYSPLKAGLASVPQGLAGLAAGLMGACLVDRFGIKVMLLATTATALIGHVLLSEVAASGDYFPIGMALIAIGLGNGGTALAATVAGSTGVSDVEQGLAGGLINSSRQIGSALGVAALMAVALSVAAHDAVPAAAALAAGYRMAFAVAGGLAAGAFVVGATCLHSNGTKLRSTTPETPAYREHAASQSRALSRRGF